jgi:ribonuclease P protein component
LRHTEEHRGEEGVIADAKIASGTDLQTQQAQTQEDSRLFGENVNKSGAQCHQAPQVERAMATDRLIPSIPPGPKGANRFPKTERLRRQKDIEACLREGKRYKHPLMTLYVRWREGEGRRIAFSVGRKVSKKATLRNRIKRWLREAYRTKRWAMKEGVDLFVIAQPACAAANFQAVDAALTELLLKAKVLKLPDYVNSGGEPTGNQKTSDETSEVG